jgi:hypothetical protein
LDERAIDAEARRDVLRECLLEHGAGTRPNRNFARVQVHLERHFQGGAPVDGGHRKALGILQAVPVLVLRPATVGLSLSSPSPDPAAATMSAVGRCQCALAH